MTRRCIHGRTEKQVCAKCNRMEALTIAMEKCVPGSRAHGRFEEEMMDLERRSIDKPDLSVFGLPKTQANR